MDTEQKIKDSKHEKQIKEQEIQRIKDNIQKTKDKEQENKDKKDQNSLQYTMNSQYINSTISNALATTNTILTIADSIDYQNPLIISLTDKEKKNHINLDNYFKKSSSVTIDYDTISVPPFSVEVHGITYHNATIDP
ncbi:MAG: hypothetical protein H6766_00285 [Candidatus Peribacteria bacterium]|nr:MAG: hypothetical protein H6766_00285 [Candidatus Peribacteria bacterium]